MCWWRRVECVGVLGLGISLCLSLCWPICGLVESMCIFFCLAPVYLPRKELTVYFKIIITTGRHDAHQSLQALLSITMGMVPVVIQRQDCLYSLQSGKGFKEDLITKTVRHYLCESIRDCAGGSGHTLCSWCLTFLIVGSSQYTTLFCTMQSFKQTSLPELCLFKG